MREVMTRSMACSIFCGGSLFFMLFFIGLAWNSHLYIVNALTAEAPQSDSVIAGKRIWEEKGCINCHTIFGEGAYFAPEPGKVMKRWGVNDDPAGAFDALKGWMDAMLVISGWLTALAHRATVANQPRKTRALLAGAGALGVVFLVIKAVEFAAAAAQGIGSETHAFFAFYYLRTGFHAAHVLAGLAIFAQVGFRPAPHPVQVAAAFWHMVELVWVLLFPVIYLLQ